MTSGFLTPAVWAGVILSTIPAVAQPSPDLSRQNPNVPAITGEKQVVPMGSNPANAVNATRGEATGLTTEQRPRLRQFALQHREIELRIRDDIGVGTVLPADATLLDIPSEFSMERYKLALANQKTLLVDPSTRRVVEVID